MLPWIWAKKKNKKRPIFVFPFLPLTLSVFSRRLPDSPARALPRFPPLALLCSVADATCSAPADATRRRLTPSHSRAASDCAPLHLALPGRRKQQAKP